jgi:hypothetical protein
VSYENSESRGTGGTLKRASDGAQPNLSERTVQALLCFRSNFLDRHHFAAFGRATKHDARASGAD